MDDEDIELMPCPFCGSDPKIHYTPPAMPASGWYVIECGNPKCMCVRMGNRSFSQVAENWNYRHANAELARLRAELGQAKAATERALELAVQYGGIDGDHHKAWVIDQMVRALLVTEPVYAQFVKDACDGEDGPDTYEWDTGVIP